MGRFSRLKQGIGGIPAEVLLPGDTAVVKRFRFQGAINVIRRSAGFPNFEIAQEVLGFLTPAETKSVVAAIMAGIGRTMAWFRAEVGAPSANGRLPIEDLLMSKFLEEFPRLGSLLAQAVIRILEKRLVALDARLAGHPSALQQRVARLQEALGLSGFEAEALTLSFLVQIDPTLKGIFGERAMWCRKGEDWKVLVTWFQHRPGFRLGMAMQVMRRFQRLGLLDDDEHPHDLLEFLLGARREWGLASWITPSEGQVFPLAQCPVSPDRVSLLLEMITRGGRKGGFNLLLHGAPGTGKTAFARSLAAEVGRRLFTLQVPLPSGGIFKREESRETIRFRWIRQFQRMNDDAGGNILLIDEADALLNSHLPGFLGPFADSSVKAAINQALDDATTVQIWITNSADGLDESTRRRFDLVIGFPPAGLPLRLNFLRHAQKRFRLGRILSPADLQGLAERFPVSAGAIETGFRNAAAVARQGAPAARVRQVIEAVLESQWAFSGEFQGQSLGRGPDPSFSLEALNLEGIDRPDTCLGLARACLSGLERACANEAPPRLGILLYGPPGTGKTEFARYLARSLQRPLLVKGAADIMSKYVGENEANLRAAFREARDRRAILFFDEVDSLLHARERAVRSWEVSLVNQLLSEFEAFGGVFLAATNHLDLVDRAALRRFQMKIGFRCLTREGRRLLYSRLLAPICPARALERELVALDGMSRLVPADFHVVRGNLQLFPERCTHRVILEALAAEAALRGEQARNPIGFRLPERQGMPGQGA
ncbi:MAG: ATP-binding protein [Candidatus Riflebacteria bacterium]|nr:ATP-binding protein [Candidatus Riflebacteria bacterium]